MAARAPPHPTASSSSPRVRLARARAAAALPSSSPSRRASRTSDPASRSRAPILDDDTNNVDRNPNATTSHPIDRWRADARSTSRSMKLANDRSRRRSRVRWGRKGVRGPGPGHDWSSSISRSFEFDWGRLGVRWRRRRRRRLRRHCATRDAHGCDEEKKPNPARVCLTRVICRARDDDGDAMRDDAGACGCASG